MTNVESKEREGVVENELGRRWQLKIWKDTDELADEVIIKNKEKSFSESSKRQKW